MVFFMLKSLQTHKASWMSVTGKCFCYNTSQFSFIRGRLQLLRPDFGHFSNFSNSTSRWIVLDNGFSPVAPIQDFLAYLNNIERSPNTVRAYAYHLKLFWEYIQAGKLDWRTVGFRELADFIGWLRDPQSIEAMPIYERVSKRTESTINAILAAVAMFYDYQRRVGVVDCLPLESETSFRGRPYKSFLHGIGKNRPTKIKRLKLKAPKRLPPIVSIDQVGKLIEACHRLRD